MQISTILSILTLSLLHFVLVDAAKVGGVHAAPAPAHKATPKVNTYYTPKPSSGSSSGDDSGDDTGDDTGDNTGDNGGSGITTTPTGAYATAAASTTSVCASNDAACNNCGLAWATVTACADVYYPYWSDFDDAELAACLCYNPAEDDTASVVWVPNQFDAPLDYCTAWASTADPDDLDVYSELVDFCTQVGNVLGATSTDWSVYDLQTPAATTSNVVTSTDGTSASSSNDKTNDSGPLPAALSLIKPAGIVLASLFAGIIILL